MIEKSDNVMTHFETAREPFVISQILNVTKNTTGDVERYDIISFETM
jgi:hypothetical protein